MLWCDKAKQAILRNFEMCDLPAIQKLCQTYKLCICIFAVQQPAETGCVSPSKDAGSTGTGPPAKPITKHSAEIRRRRPWHSKSECRIEEYLELLYTKAQARGEQRNCQQRRSVDESNKLVPFSWFPLLNIGFG